MHLPFCVAKCGYCDFNSHPGEGRDLGLYTQALVAEIRQRLTPTPPTIFVGGGTPTYFPMDKLERIFGALRERGAFEDPEVEVTVEANPESATLDKLRFLREAGANRLSIGVQSFRPEHLRAFDRVHDAEAVFRAVDAARSAGFDRVNLDLIFAKPGESLDEWLEELDKAVALAPEHLSCYELTFEEGTALTRQLSQGRVVPADEETRARLYHATLDTLGPSGFDAYEVSAFALAGEECRHNLVYWTSGDWIGVGAGAGSSLGRRKFLNVKSPEIYARLVLDGHAAVDKATSEESDPATRLGEVLMMGLRLAGGVELERVAARAGLDLLATYPDRVARLVDEGLLLVDAGWIRATPRGRDLLNLVASRFLPEG